MSKIFANFVADLFLSKYKIYRYYLLLKFLRRNYPQLRDDTADIRQMVRKEIIKEPTYFLITAALVGVVIGRFL